MKRFFLLLALLGAISLGPTMMFTSCSTPQATVTYQTLDSLGATVDAAMKTAAQLKVAGKISTAQWQQIADIHAKYRAAYNLAVDAAAGSLSTSSVPATLTSIAGDLLNLIATFK